MKPLDIYLAYAYFPHTTAVYFERALIRLGHRVHYVGSPHSDNRGWNAAPSPETAPRPGFAANVDLAKLVEMGMPDPDLVFYIDGAFPYFPRGLAEIDAPTVGYLIDVHRKLELESKLAPFFDHVFVCHRDFVPHFEENVDSAEVAWLPVASDPELHSRRDVEIEFEVGFVGNTTGEPERIRRLELLESHFKMNDWRVTRPKEEIAEIYSRSRVVVNGSVDGDLNMRVFEAMASGATLITDRIGNGQSELFTDGVHLLEYEGDDEMLEKVRWCLDNEAEAAVVGEAGMKLVLAEHTYDRRCEQVLAAAIGRQGGAPARKYSSARLLREQATIYSMMRVVDPVFDLAEEAWPSKGAWRLVGEALVAVLKRLNAIVQVTSRVRGLRRRSG